MNLCQISQIPKVLLNALHVMEHELTLILVWAVIVTITLVILVAFLLRLRKKHDADMDEMSERLNQKQTKAYNIGQSGIRGELNQILGAFAILNEYKQLASISSVSKQFSIDLLGIKEDSIDFIEVKSTGTKLSLPETNVKKLIDEKKVNYRVIEGNLPKTFEVTEREL